MKLYDRKNALVAAEILNDRAVPFFEEHQIPLLRVLTDRGTEYCGNREHHEYQLYLAAENIDHSKTKAKSPQSNGIMERFQKTVLNSYVFCKANGGTFIDRVARKINPRSKSCSTCNYNNPATPATYHSWQNEPTAEKDAVKVHVNAM